MKKARQQYLKSLQADMYFSIFWGFYPRKIDRIRCHNLFNLKLLQGVDPEDIIKGARLWTEFWEVDSTPEKYIPHPKTWIGNDRWKQEPPEPRKNDNPVLYFRRKGEL